MAMPSKAVRTPFARTQPRREALYQRDEDAEHSADHEDGREQKVSDQYSWQLPFGAKTDDREHTLRCLWWSFRFANSNI
jgi:hypothetical protein